MKDLNIIKINVSFLTPSIRKFCMGTIYIKPKLGITHFAHNYMETSHVASKPKFLKL